MSLTSRDEVLEAGSFDARATDGWTEKMKVHTDKAIAKAKHKDFFQYIAISSRSEMDD